IHRKERSGVPFTACPKSLFESLPQVPDLACLKFASLAAQKYKIPTHILSPEPFRCGVPVDQVLVKVFSVEGNKIRLSPKALLREQREKQRREASGDHA